MKEKAYESKSSEINYILDSIFYGDAVENDESDIRAETQTDTNSEKGAETTDTEGADIANGEAGADTAAETEPDTDTPESDSSDNKADEASSDEDDKGAGSDTAKAEKGSGMYETAVKVAADISEINNAFGLKIKTISDIENPKRFFELRDLGLSATEAFRATNAIKPAGNNSDTAEKQHITSATASASGGSKGLGERELRSLREHFPDKSDKEIEALYHQVKKKGLI